jgi:hypothetical protein
MFHGDPFVIGEVAIQKTQCRGLACIDNNVSAAQMDAVLRSV